MTSLTLLRWLLIGYEPQSTRDSFRKHFLGVLSDTIKLIREGSEYSVHVQSGTLYIQQVSTNEWLDTANRLAGLLKYGLGVAGEQLIFERRWGLSKQWILENGGNCWEQTWMTGSLEDLVMKLWKAKPTIERTMLGSERTIGYTLQYSDMFGDEDKQDEEDFGERKMLIFWPHNGETEWVQPADEQGRSKVWAEQFCISEDLFMNAMSRRETASQNTATTISYNIPRLRLNRFLIESNTAPHLLQNRFANDQTCQDYNPQIQSPRFATTRVTTILGGSIAGQHTTPQALSGQFTTDQTGEYVAPNTQLDRSIIHDATLLLEPNTPVTGQDSALHDNLDRTTTDQYTSSQLNSDVFAINQNDQNATSQMQPHQDTTGQDIASESKTNIYATNHESALQINTKSVRTGPDTAPQVQPAQLSTAQDTVSRAKTSVLATDHDAALEVQFKVPRKWSWEQERLMTGKDTALAGKSVGSTLWYSTRNSPGTPSTIPFSTAHLSDRASMVSAESNSNASMATAPPTRPLPSLQRGKTVENKAVTEVEALSAEELSDALVSKYAEGLLAKHRQQPKVVYPVEECNSDLESEKQSRGCELESLCNETHRNQEVGSHTTGHDSDAPSTSEGSAIGDEVSAEETNTYHDTSNNRPFLRIDMADVEGRLAVLDAAELRAMEEKNQQGNRSSAEHILLDLSERDLRLDGELQHSTEIKEELLEKLESERPLALKIQAVEEFFGAVGNEIEKVKGWTEELLEAEAKINGGYDGGWEEEMLNQKMQANEHMHNIQLDDWSDCGVTASDTSDYTRAGPSSPTEDRDAKQVYTAEEYAITSPPIPTGN
ncbi:hypothetical protein EYC80_011161 [Monilinia laxa]|uniref:Uncharacterized protein n=1 Tax=Monilinia laxa TaxID=61186 RepID=A0A5N6JP58_MONLA|nr:hypothetical protein EYC80_011161 [Monilinia laxa]